jgi:hypothetical protein
VARGGGSDALHWLVHLEPSLPDNTREIQVCLGPNEETPHGDAPPRWESDLFTLSSRSVSVQRAGTRLDTDTGLPPPVESGLNFENEPVQPNRVIPVSAQLDDAVVGRDICVLSIEVRPTWFFLQLGGSGEGGPIPGSG